MLANTRSGLQEIVCLGHNDLVRYKVEQFKTNLNVAYQCPAGQNATTFLAGNKKFTVSELEVFGFEK